MLRREEFLVNFIKFLKVSRSLSVPQGISSKTQVYHKFTTRTMALHKNYSIVAVTVIAAVALAGTLEAVPISKKAAPDVGKKYHLYKGGRRENENVQVNVEDNVTVYNVTDEQFQVAMDNSRSLIIYKMEINNTYVCFLTPMNTSEEAHWNIVANMSDEEDNNDDDQMNVFFIASQIKNKTILSPSVQEFCRDLDAYWLTQMDNNNVHIDGANTQYPEGDVHDRQKRSHCGYYDCLVRRCTGIWDNGWNYTCFDRFHFPCEKCKGFNWSLDLSQKERFSLTKRIL